MKRLMAMLPAVAVALFACTQWSGEDYARMAAARDRHARDGGADIVVAAVADPQQPDYVKGIELAVEQLNARPGRLLGRRVSLRVEQGSADAQAESRLAHRLAMDERVVAVLGHRSADAAVPASLVYEAARVVFMPPFATKKSLTGHDFRYVFRMAPSSQVMADQLASLTAMLGYTQVAVLSARDDYSRETALLFEDAAAARGVRITHRSSFVASDEDYRSLVTQLQAKPFDAVFLSAGTEPGARMARQLRELGVHTPLIGIDALDSADFRRAAGDAGNQTIVPVLYRSSRLGGPNAAFVQRFRAVHGREPDHNAAQGYDAMLLLARAIESARTTRTSAVMSALHFMPYWLGVTGLHAFDARGEPRARHYEFQQLVNGRWQPLPGLHLRYQLERAEAEARLGAEPLPAGFSQSFQAQLSLQELAALQFDLAHRLLPVQRLGVLVGVRGAQAPAPALAQIKRLGQSRGLSVETCVVHGGSLDGDLERCLKTLAQQARVQALMLAHFDELRGEDAAALAARLRAVPLPVFALSATGNRVMPAGLAVYVNEAGQQGDFGVATQAAERMLLRQAADTLVHGLANLPVVKADPQRLSALGLQSSPVLLALFHDEISPPTAGPVLPGPGSASPAPATTVPSPP
ncbi:ABC transporter substrate-binding protein [Azohydromonas lata]|uniref:ABC transporter substrate-binding protein n=1 Tax=Azohydromonas lata TaxID=45677 RepID=A0ABU5IEC1_9BURK|nr:ABC transporter substrate-binding protein [Azohydromonas lata]MDZ5456891.1 ABC transporter substrate-binding protein [Azohydromonas lata]